MTDEQKQHVKREKTKTREAFYYAGFSLPHYTMVPDDLFDVLAPNLTEGELRVVLYIIRRTFGFKKDGDKISLSQMTGGITTKEGRQLDKGTGMARSAVIRAIRGLEDKGVLIAERWSNPDGTSETTWYSLRYKDGEGQFSKSTVGGPLKVGPAVLEKNTQDTVVQDTVFEGDLDDPTVPSDPAQQYALDGLWTSVLLALHPTVKSLAYRRFAQARLVSLEVGLATFAMPSETEAAWLRGHASRLANILGKTTGQEGITVRVVVG